MISRRSLLLLLLLITLLAGVFRFVRISQPPLWFDESMVYWRTCGSYRQLLDCLRTDGFVPLHYTLVWLLTRIARPTPLILRLIPAISGTLMPAAIYLFARQLVCRGTSLLAAAFAACSAFLLFYSRDAKMYMDAWLMVTLNLGSLLWWFRGGRVTAWLCWIASGCAACDLHFSSAVPVLLSSLLLLTQPMLRWQRVLLWVLGIFIIFAGPIGYYAKFNTWKDHAQDNWSDSGLHWIGAYNHGRTGPQLVRFLGTTYLMGWEWPKDADLASIPSNRVTWPAVAAGAIAFLLLLGCLPWRQKCRAQNSECSTNTAGDPLHSALVFLWLSLLTIVPIYAFYCRSMADFSAPIDWWSAAAILHPAWILAFIALLTIALFIFVPRSRGLIWRGLWPAFVIVAVLGLCQVIAVAMRQAAAQAALAGRPWESIWVPRYMGFVWPPLAVAVAALIMRLPTRPARGLAIALLLGVNLAFASFRIFGQTEPPVDRMVADDLLADDSSHRTLAWFHLDPGQLSPGSGNLYSGPGAYYLDVLLYRRMTPPQFQAQMRELASAIPFASTPWYRNLPADVDRVILWNEYAMVDNRPAHERKPPAGWVLENEQWCVARDCWIWKDLSRYRRQVWRRVR